jgi:hypothetical protein
VKKDKFLQILDFCGGQTNNPALYDDKFLDEIKETHFLIENNMAKMYTTVSAQFSKQIIVN